MIIDMNGPPNHGQEQISIKKDDIASSYKTMHGAQ
jgi:hypothetical protein